jgi:KDO2-lipid IV(A) lauroyltransferase
MLFMKRLISWAGRSASFFIYIAPLSGRRALGAFLAFLWFDLLRIRRQVVLDNIAIAFPEMSRADRIALGRRSLYHLGLNFLEYALWPFLNKKNYTEFVEFHGLDVFDRALAKGKGVLLLTCHLGHGDLGVAGLSVHGYDMVMVSKFFKLRWLNDLWFAMRERLGTRFVAPRNSSYALLKALKRGAAVVVPLDQFTGPPIGVRTTFFKRETGTAAGLAVMAQRSKAPVVSVYTFRNAQGKQSIQFVREMAVNMDEPAEVLTQRFNDELENFVRLHPDQWMWIHKRWKRFKY